MLDDVFDQFGELFTAGNVCFFYSGYLSQPLLTAMVEGFKVKLEREAVSTPVRRRLLSSLVEMTQNIIHYARDTLTPNDQNDHQLRWGSISVTLTQGHYLLECANRVDMEQALFLRDRIEPLRLMTHAQIKEGYAQAIRQETPDGSKGAGLGLMTIARDAQAPLAYRIIEDATQPGTAIFLLKATI
ncbi:SiaB family protein kinase [Chitinimonas sp. BJB300]|uniref:SiaB family protein kinase n=1 Tax=Chitinimonas sp. BJB300 TaxID=1559339 RepID=UPI000C0CFA78|nr:SiaB family protein kinase [Chitinimonas sp. BJB300]PHV13154.1 hypothetical protein CSQ89_01790 [Chitinimonas sp. BJB300]TSJ87135.1 hypothetical protein FG002_015290 [Chitinimonas sp. BJB300]